MKTSSQVLFSDQGTSSGKLSAWRTGVRQCNIRPTSVSALLF